MAASRTEPAPRVSQASAGAVLALAALVCLLGGLVGVLAAPAMDERSTAAGAVPVLLPVLLVWLGPALVSLSAVALLRDLRLLTAAPAVVSGATSCVAWGLAALASASWSAGFVRADAGLPATSLSRAFTALFLAALLVGALALAVAADGATSSTIRSARGRRTVVAVAALPAAAVLGLGAAVPGSALVVAAALLVACALRRTGTWRPPVGAGLPAAGAAAPVPLPALPQAPPRAQPSAPPRRAVVALAGLSAALGLPWSVYAVAGEPWRGGLGWLPADLARLPAMNAGLAAGSLASLPLLAALGLLAARRWGRRGAAPVVLLAAALLLRAVSAAMGPTGDAGTALLLVGALLVGVAAVLPLSHRLPAPGILRWGATAVLAAALGCALGVPVVAAFPLGAPLAGAAVAVLASRRPRLPLRAA